MVKMKSVFLLILSCLVFTGCQNDNLNLKEDVTTIEVYEWDSDERVDIIENKEFIEKVVKELENARTESTAAMNYVLPDYELIFQHEEAAMFDIGYYNQTIHLGVEGRYLDVEEDVMYGVDLPLPLD